MHIYLFKSWNLWYAFLKPMAYQKRPLYFLRLVRFVYTFSSSHSLYWITVNMLLLLWIWNLWFIAFLVHCYVVFDKIHLNSLLIFPCPIRALDLNFLSFCWLVCVDLISIWSVWFKEFLKKFMSVGLCFRDFLV